MVTKDSKEILAQALIQIAKTRKPSNVQELVRLTKEKTGISESEITRHIIILQGEGRIVLKPDSTATPQKLSTYLKTKRASWYWITLIIAALTTITVFAIPEDAYPMVYIRYLLGTFFVLCLPGYSITKALFPETRCTRGSLFKTSSKGLDSVERIALSVGLSLALVPMIGLILNYTPFGIRLTPIVLCLLALTLVSATAGIIREHSTQRKVMLKPTRTAHAILASHTRIS